jgi:hypothetical protein
VRPILCASAAGLALAFAALASCDTTDPIELPRTPASGTGAGTPYDAGAVDTDGDATRPTPDAEGGVVTPILLGITPTPRSVQQDEPTAGDQLDAELTTFAAGVRGVVVTRRLHELPDDPSLARLGGFYAQHRKQVLFNVALVDRAEDGRPEALSSLAWDDPAVVFAVKAAIDAAVARFGETLAYVTFGRDADVYLAGHPDERVAFTRLAAEACAYAGAHPDARERPHVGVGLSFDAAMPPDGSSGASLDELLDAGDVAVLSYLPGLAAGEAAPTSDVAGGLDAMIARSQGLPIVLQAVGYPSSPGAGSSEERQRLFFQTFFNALAPRRASFTFVNVVELHDPPPAVCAAYAAAQGAEPESAFARFTCSLGLFGQGEASKPAWIEILGGAATFASP